jgi:hypothetical protein
LFGGLSDFGRQLNGVRTLTDEDARFKSASIMTPISYRDGVTDRLKAIANRNNSHHSWVALPDRRARLPFSSGARGELLELRWWRIASVRFGDGLDPDGVSQRGVNMATYIDGEQGGPWIVLSNSRASDYSSSDEQLSLLTQNFRVLRYDTRGHGRSAAPEGP